MKRFFLPYAFLVSAILVLVGIFSVIRHCVRPAQSAYCDQPDVIVENMVPSLDMFVPMWQQEVGRRFHHALVILVHGGDFLEGEWIVGSESYGHPVITAKQVVSHFQQQFPDRTIVLIACNTGHLKLGIPGVYYAHSSVWCVPDRAVGSAEGMHYGALQLDGPIMRFETVLTAEDRSKAEPDIIGNIYEFSADKD